VTGKAIQNIPIVIGIKCNICHYVVIGKNVIKNHFTENHKNISQVKNTEQCKVQLVFNGRLHKYIQIEEDENMGVDMGADID